MTAATASATMTSWTAPLCGSSSCQHFSGVSATCRPLSPIASQRILLPLSLLLSLLAIFFFSSTNYVPPRSFSFFFPRTSPLLFADGAAQAASQEDVAAAAASSSPSVSSASPSDADTSASTGAGGEDPKQVLEELKSMLGMDAAEMQHRVSVVFDFMDSDHDGELSDDEVKRWIGKTKEAVQRKQVVVEMETIDKDGDKKVTFEEMQAAYADADGETVTEETLKELRKRFNTVDKDKDNALSLEEIGLLMNPGKDEGLMQLEVEEILNAQDKDKDGKISLEEFMTTEEQLSPEDATQYESEFKTYDSNLDGFIDEKEIRKVVAEPHQQEIADSAAELRKLGLDGKLTRSYWVEKFHKFVISGATDSGELLRYPKEYNLELPFEDIPKAAGEEQTNTHAEEEGEHEEL